METTLNNWEKFYMEVFGVDVKVEIPKRPQSGEWWLVVVAKDLTLEKIFHKCEEIFDTWASKPDGDDVIDDVIDDTISCRDADKSSYALYVSKKSEFPFSDINRKWGLKGITLEERLILELFCFWSSKEHLEDPGSASACSGSQCGSRAPLVYFYKGVLAIEEIGHWMLTREVSV